MLNLKPYLDAAKQADEEKSRILEEIDAAFNEGTDEGKQKALDLRPALEKAQMKANEANELYVSMRDASLVNDDMAALFTAPPDPAAGEPEAEQATVMSRDDFERLDPTARMSFMKAGGKLKES